jgi:hypothetical protein
MNDDRLTLKQAQEAGRLAEFAAQQEAAGIGAANFIHHSSAH